MQTLVQRIFSSKFVDLVCFGLHFSALYVGMMDVPISGKFLGSWMRKELSETLSCSPDGFILLSAIIFQNLELNFRCTLSCHLEKGKSHIPALASSCVPFYFQF